MNARARAVAALGCGLLFALGLELSGMTDPAKVIGFLDIAGAWDPSLACVMGGALVVVFFSFRSILPRPSSAVGGRARPLLDDRFHVPSSSAIDAPLLAGAVVFGIGWGLAGYCPGPALVSSVGGGWSAPVFTVAMVLGMVLFRLRSSRPLAGARRSAH